MQGLAVITGQQEFDGPPMSQQVGLQQRCLIRGRTQGRTIVGLQQLGANVGAQSQHFDPPHPERIDSSPAWASVPMTNSVAMTAIILKGFMVCVSIHSGHGTTPRGHPHWGEHSARGFQPTGTGSHHCSGWFLVVVFRNPLVFTGQQSADSSEVSAGGAGDFQQIGKLYLRVRSRFVVFQVMLVTTLTIVPPVGAGKIGTALPASQLPSRPSATGRVGKTLWDFAA